MKTRDKFFAQLNKLLESEHGTLPIFSAVSVQIQLELVKDQPDLKIIEKLIIEDQSLSSTVLRLANSARFFGLLETTTVKSAIIRLGMAEILQIVISDISNTLFHSNDPQIDSIMKLLWQHSVACAFSSGILANNALFNVIREEAFSAGLFHDIGKLLILKVIEEKRKKYKILDVPNEILLEAIEQLHAKHGGKLMERIKLPKIYATVARDHHLKSYDRTNNLLLIVRLANNICHKMEIGLVKEPTLNIMNTDEATTLNVSQDEIDIISNFLYDNKNIFGFS